MAIWGALIGVAAATADQLLSDDSGRCVPPTVDQVRRLFIAISAADRQAWTALDTGSRQISASINSNDATRLVQQVTNSDCDPPHPIVREMYRLLGVYGVTQQQPSTTVSTTQEPNIIDSITGYAGAIASGAQAGAQQAAQAGTLAAQQAQPVQRIDPLLIVSVVAAGAIIYFATR